MTTENLNLLKLEEIFIRSLDQVLERKAEINRQSNALRVKISRTRKTLQLIREQIQCDLERKSHDATQRNSLKKQLTEHIELISPPDHSEVAVDYNKVRKL